MNYNIINDYNMNYNIINDYNTKYNYTKNENDQELYIFELILKTTNDEILTFRSIKKNKQGIIDIDNILFDTINNFKLTILHTNHINNQIILKKIIDHSNNSNTYLNDILYLEINKRNNFIEFNYNIIN